ncbi:MAG TPA: GNAT family N-acetyltransferase [Bacillales bacterium]|nr:GNAT family N-acetyltransferase [Bacillales bacterium]
MGFQATIKVLRTMEELKGVRELEQIVWGMDPLPLHQTFTASRNGGLLLGAYDRERLIGFSYSFPGFAERKPYLCSHMLAVHPDYRGRQIGWRLKQEQRRKAIDFGYDLIVWTYDPLLSRNAHLNLHKLGGVAVAYEPNLYGEMEDRLNRGLPSDRFKIHWQLGETVKNLRMPEILPDRVWLDAELDSTGMPAAVDGSCGRKVSDQSDWFVAIPADFLSIKQQHLDLAIDWRRKSGEAFATLFGEGFVAPEFVKSASGQPWHYYWFTKK